jgi:hypothetical protein
MHAGELLQSLVVESCSQLRTTQEIEQNPALADDTFLLASRALNYAPQSVFTAPLLAILLETAEKGILVQHRCHPLPFFRLVFSSVVTYHLCFVGLFALGCSLAQFYSRYHVKLNALFHGLLLDM